MTYKRNIYLFIIFDFLTTLSPLTFIYALFLSSRDISLVQIGLIISVYQISKLIFEVPSGYFSDRYGRKKCGIIGQFTFIIFLILTLITHSYILFLSTALIRGISYAFLSGTADCIFSESILKECPEEMDRLMGIDKILYYTSIGLSSIIGGLLAKYSYESVFYFNIIIQTISLICMFMFKETIDTNTGKMEKVEISTSLKYSFKDKKVVYLILLPAILAICFLPYEDYYSTLIKSYEVDESVIGIMSSCVMIASAVFGTITYKINKRYGYNFSVKKLPLLVILMFLIMSLLQDHILLSWIIYVVAQGCFSISNISYNSCLQKNIENTSRGTIMSLRSLLMAIVGMIISPMVGYGAEKIGFSMTYIVCAIICLFLLIVSLKYLMKDNSFDEI
jgi:MFS family permease